MKKLCILIVSAAAIILSAVLASAEVNTTGQILSVTKSQPDPVCCSPATDTPLQASAWDYKLRVRVGANTYDVEYAASLGYFPSNLVSGSDVHVRVAHHHMYLVTAGGELETNVIGQHLDATPAYCLSRNLSD